MLASGYDGDHAGGIDAALYRSLVVGQLPARVKSPLLSLVGPLVRDPIRLLCARLTVESLARGRWRSVSLPRPTTYRAAHPNLAADVAAVTRIAPIVNLDVAVEPVPAPDVPDPGRCFTPPWSGLFSTVFAVLCHRFLRGDELPVNTRRWPYAVPLEDLLGGRFVREHLPADRLGPLRERIFRKPETHPAFTAFVRDALAGVHERSRAILAHHGIALPPVGAHAAWFVRRGDKLTHEAIDVPVAAYLRSIDRLACAPAAAPPLIVGDDDRFIARIRRARSAAVAFEAFPPLAGSTLAPVVGLDRTLAILANFCILCEARDLVGDAHCNLVAAAMAVRGDTVCADPTLFPWSRLVLV